MIRTPQPISRLAVLAALFASTLACGKKGDPRPPLRPTPATIADLRLAERGDQVEIRFTVPRASGDGGRLPVLEIELFVAQGTGDFAKTAITRRLKAAPGEVLTETLPLPAPGTALRASARAIARGHKGRLADPARLVVVAPLSGPTDLTATLVGEGVALAWQGEVPAPLPTPTPSPTPTPTTPTEPASPNASAPQPAASSETTTSPAPTPTTPTAPTPTPTPTPLPAAVPNQPAAPTQPVPPGEPPTVNSTPVLPAGATQPSPGQSLLGPGGLPTPKPTPTPEPFVPGFFIYRRAAANAYGAPLAPMSTPDRAFVDRITQPGESWCYVIRAAASAQPLVESAPSNEACIDVKDVLAPATPAGLAAIPRDEGIEVSWSPSPEPDLLAYRVYRAAKRGGAGERVAEIAAPETTFLDKDPPEGALLYTVTAVDRAGNESPPTPPSEARRP